MDQGHLLHEDLTRSIIGAFFKVYNTLGFGFLEHIYVSRLSESSWRAVTSLPVNSRRA